MLKTFSYWCAGIGFAIFGAWLSSAQAENAPQFYLQINSSLLSGRISGDRSIGQGRISYDGNHLGFQVWSEATKSGVQPNRYVLVGQNNSNNKLRVRIEQTGWVPDKEGGKGIILHSGSNSATVNVVIDGDQTVVSDNYSLALNGTVLLP